MAVPIAPQVPAAQPAAESQADAQLPAKLERVASRAEGTLVDVARQVTEVLGIEVEGGMSARTIIDEAHEALFGKRKIGAQAVGDVCLLDA